jgi:hypothetical protein
MTGKDSTLMRCSESTQKSWVKDRVALNSIEAISFVRERGIPMSKSRLYKLTAQKHIPFRKAGERLVFSVLELEAWCEGQLTDPFSGKGEAVTLIVKSAQRQSSINN